MLWIFLSCSAIAESDWQTVRTASQDGEVSTWVRPVEGATINQFRGEVVLPNTPLEVLLVLDDIDHYSEWVFHCQSSSRIEGGVYLRFDGFWPVSDRDATLVSHVNITDNTVHIHTSAKDGLMSNQRGYVRIPELNNHFEITLLPDGGSRVIFTTFVDPSGSLPRWISNIVAKNGPLVTLSGLRDKLQNQTFNAPNKTHSPRELSRLYDPIKTELEQLLHSAQPNH